MQSKPFLRVKNLASKFKKFYENYESLEDERAVCSHSFYLLHIELSKSLESNDLGFTDLNWVAQLSENFAERFFNAMNSIDYQVKNKLPINLNSEFYLKSDFKPWIHVYNAICTKRSYVFECLIFPLLAHIGYDLPLALVKTKLETNGNSRIGDFHLINEVLARQIENVQNSIKKRYNGNIAFLDKIAGQFDEFATNYGMRVSRGLSWYNAERVIDPISNKKTLKAIKNIRKPKKPLSRIINNILRLIIPTNKKWPK